MATAYQYTADGYYAGEIEDHGLLPHNATYVAPPEAPDAHVAWWDGAAWALAEDHRGQQGYLDGQPHTITALGPLPAGWSDEPSPPSLAEAQAARRAEIAAGFNAAMAASLTMPSASAPPSAYEVATALYDWRVDDPDGYAELVAIHEARRAALLAAVDVAEDTAAVLAIVVSYAV